MAPRPLDPRNHSIPLAAAAEHTRRHRQANTPGFALRAGAFHADQVQALLAQQGCVGLRIYLGRDESNQPSFVLVGMDAAGADMTSGTVLEINWPCPPYCDDASPLAV